MEPGGQWRIVWSQAQALNNMERCLLSLHCSLIVPYKASHRGRERSSKMQQETATELGEPNGRGLAAQSTSSGLARGRRAPAESFIFLSAVTPPPLINACPGVFFSEAKAAFFILQDGSPNWWRGAGTCAFKQKQMFMQFLSSPPLLSDTHKTPGVQFP